LSRQFDGTTHVKNSHEANILLNLERRVRANLCKVNVIILVSFTRFFYSLPAGLRSPPSLTCAVVHAGAFAVNAALVASQWQYRARTASLHSSINTEHEAVFFGMSLEPNPTTKVLTVDAFLFYRELSYLQIMLFFRKLLSSHGKFHEMYQ